MDTIDLNEAFSLQNYFFNNEYVGIVMKGRPKKAPFLKEGEIYHIVEPRLLIILSGEAEVSLNLENYHFEKGTVILTTSDVIIEPSRWSEDMELIGIVFKEDIHVDENIVLDFSPTEYERLLRMAYFTWDMVHLMPFRRETVQHLLLAMVTDIQNVYAASEKADKDHKPSRQQQLFLNFKKLVSEYCERERSIPFYAEQLWISPHHLSAVISKVSGKSVMYWINRAVILRAKVLLKTSDMMTYEIADRLNFPSASAFNKFFKRETGMTPGEYQTQK